MIEAPSDCSAQAKGQGHSSRSNPEGNLPIADQEAQIDLEPDQEQEQQETEVGDEVQVRQGLGRKDVGGETRNAAHDGGTEDDASDDFGDDARLSQLGEWIVQQTAEDDDDACLDDEDGDWVL